jgi:hypothetical protein
VAKAPPAGQDADTGMVTVPEEPRFITNAPIWADCRYMLKKLLAEYRHGRSRNAWSLEASPRFTPLPPAA